MPNNINISSGSDFSKKKFGSITKLTKPTFVHNGKVFSDNIFKNQRTIPLLADDQYFFDHGLLDADILIDYSISVIIDNTLIQQLTNNYNTLSINSSNSLAIRNTLANITSIASASSTIGTSSLLTDPYDNNPPDCPVP